MPPRALKPETVRRRLAELRGWKLSPRGTTLSCSYHLTDPLAALARVFHITLVALRHQHFPRLELHRQVLEVTVWTPQCPGITAGDLALAAAIHRLHEDERAKAGGDPPAAVSFEGFGPALRGMRQQRGLSQSDLAARAGMQAPQICVYERGHCWPTLPTLATLLNGLGASLGHLDLALRRAPRPDHDPEEE